VVDFSAVSVVAPSRVEIFESKILGSFSPFYNLFHCLSGVNVFCKVISEKVFIDSC